MGTKEFSADDLGAAVGQGWDGEHPPERMQAALAVLETITPYAEAEKLVEEVCRRHGVDLLELRGPVKTKEMVDARRDAARVLRALGLSSLVIGRLLKRDHSSILSLLRTVRAPAKRPVRGGTGMGFQ